MRLALAWALTLALAACQSPVELVVTAAPGGGLDLTRATISPAGAARVVERGARRLVLAVARPGALRIDHPDACPAEVRVDRSPAAIALRPLVDLGGDRPQLGFDAPFEITVEPGCELAARGRIEWTQAGGAPLALESRDGGFHLRGRTRPLGGAPLSWGVAPLAPAAAGEARLVATWRGEGRALTREIAVSAAARSPGLTSVAAGHRLLLGGRGWHVAGAPAGGRAQVIAASGAETFLPDASGRWRLVDGDGRALPLRVSRYDETPLDCGRAECHPQAARFAAASPMTTVLHRGLDGALGAAYDARCALACHATGEPGVDDGGFDAVARALGVTLPSRGAPGSWDALPRALRRLGGVGCTACHGPGAIPERDGRWAILRADVCAVCHDAPPRYGHVAAWRASPMARADAAPETRAPRCAPCHTTRGFLASLGVRSSTSDWTPPAAAAPIGISCAACHAPHDAHAERAILRRPEVPRALADARVPEAARVCLPCHAPLDGRPAASSAALWFGAGGVDLQTGAPRSGARLHAAVADGCIGCHAGRPDAGLERGRGHTFTVDESRCPRCHGRAAPVERPGPDGRRVAERARDLWTRLIAAGAARPLAGGRPPHAAGEAPAPDAPLERAVFNVRLILEDRAAGIHNAPYARALLDEVEALLAPRR